MSASEGSSIGRHGDEAALRHWRRSFLDCIELPVDATVIGQPVTVLEIIYDGNPRLGLTLRCRTGDNEEHLVALADVRFHEDTNAARLSELYQRWLAHDPEASLVDHTPSRKPRPGVHIADTSPVELIVLSVKERAARCRLLSFDHTVTLRATRLWDVVPGEIVTVRPRRRWRYARSQYLSGDILSTRLDVTALGLTPLGLERTGTWDPAEEYWGEEGDELEAWAQTIIARGPRPEFEMEQVLPGTDPGNPDSDPIIESNDRKDAGDFAGARRMLMALLDADLRCLDAHAHLGNLAFDHHPAEALRHYEAGVRIGDLSLNNGPTPVLRWACIDNRPFLRCLQGYGLCLWRLGRWAEAARVFDRMLWLNPSDNQGMRFLLPAVHAQERWEKERW
jgi:hypothetical protein